jgi:hypothetical protein
LEYVVSIGEDPIFQSHVESSDKRVDDCAAAMGQGDVIDNPYEELKLKKGSVIDEEVSAPPFPGPLSC